MHRITHSGKVIYDVKKQEVRNSTRTAACGKRGYITSYSRLVNCKNCLATMKDKK